MAWRRRFLEAALLLWASGVGVGQALAGHDLRSEVTFVAWSADSRHFLLQVKDENRGTVLAVKEVGKQASVFEQVLDPAVPPAQALAHPYYAQFRFTDPGVQGSSPQGLMVMGSPVGTEFVLYLSDGKGMTRLLAIPLGHSPDFTAYARATVKQVVWNAAGTVAAVLVHQELQDSNGLSVDQVVSFPVAPYRAALGGPSPKPTP